MDEHEYEYNLPFTMHELDTAVQSLKLTSPGHDLIHNNMLKHLPPDYLEHILHIMNQNFNDSLLLPKWKLAILLPIAKMGET